MKVTPPVKVTPLRKHSLLMALFAEDRQILVWLEHMMNAGRNVLLSLFEQVQGNTKEYEKLKRTVDDVTERNASWPQSKWYLKETEERLFTP